MNNYMNQFYTWYKIFNKISEDNPTAMDKFQDIYVNTVGYIQQKYSLPSFHIWDSGYCIGDVSVEELKEFIKTFSEKECILVNFEKDEFNGFNTNIFDILDGMFLQKISEGVDELIEKYKETKIILSYDELRKLLINEMVGACEFSWTGWRIPIYLHEVKDIERGETLEGTFSSGGWLSQNSWQPNTLEVFKIERWELDEYDEDEISKDEEIEFQADYHISENFNDIVERIEENIFEYFNHKYFENYFEIKIEWK